MSLWRLKNSNGVFDLLNVFNLAIESHVGTGMPPQEVITTEFGLADGSLAQRIVVKERPFKLIGTIGGNSLEELRQHRQALIDEICRDQVVSEDEDGIEVITPVILQYTLDNFAVIEIDCLYRSGLEGGAQQGFMERLTLEFLATDPFWRNPDEESDALNVNSNTDVQNDGTTAAYPIMTLAGEGEILSLENVTTEKTVTFDGLSVIAGEVVTLDLRPGRKTLESDVRGNLQGVIAAGVKLSAWNLARGANTVLLSAQADAEILDENGEAILDENDDPLLSSDTLNLTTRLLTFQERHWSIDGVTV